MLKSGARGWLEACSRSGTRGVLGHVSGALPWAPHPRVCQAAHFPQTGTLISREEREKSPAPRIFVQSGRVGRGAGDFTIFFFAGVGGRETYCLQVWRLEVQSLSVSSVGSVPRPSSLARSWPSALCPLTSSFCVCLSVLTCTLGVLFLVLLIMCKCRAQQYYIHSRCWKRISRTFLLADLMLSPFNTPVYLQSL